jgi:lipopolysaccharide export system protein LptA
MRLLCLFSLLGVLILPCLNAGLDTITPSAPVKDFRFPNFGANGYTQWVLRGARGIYDGPEQIRVEAMGLRIYTGDERMAVELSLDSPAAAIRLQENRAESEARIRIAGANFEITGLGWTWDGAKKDIVVSNEARAEFTQGIFQDGDAASEAAAGQTVVRSESLRLQTTAEDFAFDFTGSVEAESGAMRLWSERLLATADTPQGSGPSGAPVGGELQGLRDLLAEGSVVLEEGERRLRAERARFYPGTELVELEGAVQVEAAGALINGERIRSEGGEVVITGKEGVNRAQMVLVQAGGLGLSGKSGLDEVTIIHADSIVMVESEESTEFEFEGRVEVLSGALTLRAEHLTVLSETPERETAEAEVEVDLPVGKVRELYARGSVYLEDAGREVQAEEARFFPNEEKAKLRGNPRLSHEGAVVSGVRMDLSPQKAWVYGDAATRVRVLLPELPNLGYDSTEADATAEASRGIAPAATLIESKSMEMREMDWGQLYTFRDSVQVTGTNLLATCGSMEVRAKREALPEGAEASLVGGMQIESIFAQDAVQIKQEGRVTRSETALIDPVASRLVLEGDAWVDDARGQVRGERLVLNKGERRAIVGGGPGGKRARVTLPELPKTRD